MSRRSRVRDRCRCHRLELQDNGVPLVSVAPIAVGGRGNHGTGRKAYSCSVGSMA
ncbi:hypothetical protein NJ7G_0490 [Natrinema sp. J7-2]|nr:hypothetical protein NJ7G_0490 [Natrinema sp. J7-2]